jgi:hypothetical protein
MTRSHSVLIGFADALAAPEVAASLLAAGYHVGAFVRRSKPVTLSRVESVELIEVTAPEHDLCACMADVAGAAARFDLTMPLNDPALLICDQGLPQSATVAGPRGRQAQLAVDKRLQLTRATQAGMSVPEWTELDPRGGVPADCELPAVLKPALAIEALNGRARRLSPCVVTSRAEAEAVWSRWGESTAVILQRWVPGAGAGIFGLAGANGTHRLSAHRRVRMMNPAGSGSSACASSPVPADLVGPVDRFMAGAGWEGMFMVELLRSGVTTFFMELNGRAWGSLALSRRLGYEYPAWAVARTIDPGAELPEPPPFQDLLCRHLGRELVHLSYVLRGPRRGAGQWPHLWSTLRDLTRPGRPTAWYNRDRGLRGVLLYDTYRTVADQTWARAR